MEEVILGLVTAMLMQWWKQSALPLLNTPSGPSDKLQEWVNRAASIIMAGLVTLGVHYSVHVTGTGFDAAFSGTWAGIASGAGEWVRQFAAQHGMYKLVVVMPQVLGDIRTQIEVYNNNLANNGKSKG